MAKKKKNSHPDWHPNFRIEADLPDIKPIRTDFLVNGVAWALALFLVFAVVQREITANSMRSRIQDTRAQISSLSGNNEANLKLSKEFTDFLPRVQDIERFYGAPVVATEFIQSIVEQVPEGMRLTGIKMQSRTETVKKAPFPVFDFNVSGTAPSLPEIDAFKETLAENEALQAHRGTINELPSSRDPVTGLFSFTLEITLAPEYK